MNKIIQTVMLTLIGAGCFSGGLYYGIDRSEESLERVMGEYVVISEKVDAFVDVSNPKTIRLYTTELRKILDDVTFLGKMVEEGQTSAESLSDFFSEYDKSIDDVNQRLLELSQQHNESITNHRTILAGLSEDLNETIDITEEEQNKLKEQSDYINQLNVQLGHRIKQLEEDIDKIKNSTYWLRDKKIWRK
jgi:predicted  nucleic acid-binding Zn-ribbon protein